jgi:hypothetical protein
MSLAEYDEETYERINKKLDIILELLRADNLEKIDQAVIKYELINIEQKNNEYVKKSDESLALGDDESGEKLFESKSGDIEQRKNDQKATKVIREIRRVSSARKRSKLKSAIASSKNSTEFACEEFSSRLPISPFRVFMWKKKYKWDDGG